MLPRRWLATQARKADSSFYTSILLNRAPFLTRTPSEFETAYWAYKARIRRSLHNPFPYDFYFKPGSIIETTFNIEEREREVQAFGAEYVEHREQSGIGGASIVSEAQKTAAETLQSQEGSFDVLMERSTKADATGNTQSLDRLGERNLFCLLNTQSHGWRLPFGPVNKAEPLHNAAQRDLAAECGENMDTWIVSKQPIGHYELSTPEHVVFFYKAHIFQGQVKPQSPNITDFAWLTTEEIQSKVSQDYWDRIKDILPTS